MKKFFKKDSVWLGIIMGLIVPTVVYGVLRLVYEFMESVGLFSDFGFADDFRTRTLALIAICANLFVMQFYRRTHRHHETTRGMLIASMMLVGIWLWKFGFKILKF